MQDSTENTESNELYEHYKFTADKGQGALRVDKYLCHKLEKISRNKIQSAASAGNILVNQKKVKSNYKVKPDDVVSIVMSYPPREFEIIPENIPVDIVYEDKEIVVVDKQPGMVVHPGHGNYTGTLVNALAWHIKDSPLFNGDTVRPGLVHRIDKDTSGLLVVAKTEEALEHLARQFYERTTDRKYLALVWGSIKEDQGTITGNIARHQKDRMRFDVFEDEEIGKHAVTHFHVLERLGYVTLVQCVLETGRTHQIRVHMKHTGHPLFNDERYGGNQILKGTTFTKYKQFVHNCFKILPRQALHAQTLGFEHPDTGERMFFESPIPDDILKAIEKWRTYTASRHIES
jgi:23S rRNA pseudouridine1911/1915/1917 synthase